MIIRYRMGIPRAYRRRARQALELLFDGWGVAGLEVSGAAPADIIYGPHGASSQARVSGRMPLHDARPGSRDTRETASPVRIVWSGPAGWARPAETVHLDRALRELRVAASGSGAVHVGVDILRIIDHVTSGEAERSLPTNSFGVPLLASPSDAARLLGRPVVPELSILLESILEQRLQGFGSRLARWPGGRSAAVLMTHDVDQPYSRPRPSFYRERIANALRRHNPIEAARATLGWARVRVQEGAVLPPTRDPNFGFDFWRGVERAHGARGCFYVAVRSAAEPGAHPMDVAYDASDPEMVRAMRDAVEAGWEIGLHASIHAAREPGRFVEEKRLLESLLGTPVSGVRHHYWSLRPGRPDNTWSAHRDAGFIYDSSLGTNDEAGYRRGMAWPFLPPDMTGKQLLQIPPTLMDGGIFYTESGARRGDAAIRSHMNQVIQVGGAVVLDWHLEQSNPERLSGAGPALLRVLDGLRGQSEIWWPTPSELAAWWLERARRRKALLTTRESIRLDFGRAPVGKEPTGSIRRPDVGIDSAGD